MVLRRDNEAIPEAGKHTPSSRMPHDAPRPGKLQPHPGHSFAAPLKHSEIFNERIDGCAHTTTQPHIYAIMVVPEVTLTHLNRADGSATYTHNGYSIIGAVNGPIEVLRKDEMPEEATIEVNVRPAVGVGSMADSIPYTTSFLS